MARLHKITVMFPRLEVASHTLLSALRTLVADVEGVTATTKEILLRPIYPHDATPATAFRLTKVMFPSVQLTMDDHIYVRSGTLTVFSRGTAGTRVSGIPPVNPPAEGRGLSPTEVALRFAGHIVRVDHTGVEFPASIVTRGTWDELLARLAVAASLYDYPDEAWSFILPSSDAEFADEIRSFAAPRSPKFELTYGYVDVPLVQIHFDTDLSQADVEARLPAPAGFALPGVQTFRSVYLAHPWPDLLIRCDFTFAGSGSTDDWETGRWLVTEGRRHRAPDDNQGNVNNQ